MKTVCILGAYGVFGRRIAKILARDNIPIIIAGRNKNALLSLQNELKSKYVSISVVDIAQELASTLEKLKPSIVINTCGPFQGSDYSIAKTCISLGIHYIDLADGRDYVNHFDQLNSDAIQNHVIAITGASTVPGLSSAVIEKYKTEFKQIDKIDFGITPGAKAPRGIATVKSILSYLGKPIRTSSSEEKRYGWQDLHRVKYPELGYRWMGNCDIPDLDLIPSKYGIKEVHFSAGMESSGLHLSIWFLSWLVRLGLPINLQNHAVLFEKLSHLFDFFGSDNGGMHIILKGIDPNNKPLTLKWFLIVKHGGGPYVPTIPSVIVAKKILTGDFSHYGAYPCLGLVSLEDYQRELQHFAANYHVIRE